MEQGLDFLKGLGLCHVDVTPAAFMAWTPGRIALFKKNYLALARRPQLRRLMYANEDNERMAPQDMDLSLHPPGYLLGGDAFLCLPEDKRMEFNLWDTALGTLKGEVLRLYQDAYEQRHKRHTRLPYREFVCNNFELINTMMGHKYVDTQAMNGLLRFLTRTHLTLGIRKYGR